MRIFRLIGWLIPLLLLGSAIAATNPDNSAVPSEIVAAHNFVRSKAGVPPLVWSEDLARVAQDWATTLINIGAFAHSRDPRYGENLFEISGPGASSRPFEVISAWAAEASGYRYQTNTCLGVCGHYTQIVWRDTKAVGCAAARGNNREIWVCNYAPYGNIVGEKPY